MNIHIKAIAAAVLAVGLTSGSCAASAQTAPAPAAKKPVKHAAKPKAAPKPKPAPPATAAELQELRQQMETQINALKEQLSSKDSQLRQAQDAATAAQAAASRAEAAASSQQQAVTENAAAVTTLQGTVTDLKANQAGLVTTIQDNQAMVKKAIESPDAVHYKGVELTPGGFTAAETVYRSRATGGDIATPFTSIPFEATNQAQLSEWYSTARQSRVSLDVAGKLPWGTLRGYWEADWLGTGVTSNNNQSNSYVLRQRVIWGQAALNNGWAFTGGQLWSLAAENAKGISNFSSNTPLPQTIDPNYAAGFVWTRQYGFRVTKSFDKFAIGVAAENPQVLSPGGSVNLNPYTTYLWGQPGSGGGLYNGGASTTNGTTVGLLTTYAINPVPDFLAKVTFDPGLGHYEIFGISRFFRDRVYNYTCPKSAASCTSSVATGGALANAYNDTEVGGGVGASARVPLFEKKLTLGLKGLWGTGVGRYGDSTIADVTLKPNGEFSPLHNFSGLSTVEVQATPRLLLYANYGGDYVGKTIYISQTGKKDGYGLGEAFSGCATEPLPTGPTYPASNSSCTGQTRDIQETTVGYWYDFYKGPKGRLRQGIQYSYAEKFIWDNLALTQGSVSPKGIENMVWTSFRYYIP